METEIKHTRNLDTVLDVTEEQVARVYAEAFLGAAEQAGVTSEAVEQLSAVVKEVLDPYPQFSEAIRSAFLSHEEREALIDRVLGGRVDKVVINTLKVMSQHDRLRLLRIVARQAQDMFDKNNGRRPVQVTTASPLSDELTAELESTLRAKLGIEPILRTAVDPDLIAGVLIRVDDTVYDGSVRTAITKAKQSIIEQTVARIEQTPEHFFSESN